MKQLLFLFLLTLFFSSCGTVAHMVTEEGKELSLRPTSAEKIEVYFTKKISKDFEIIGQVVAAIDAGYQSARAVNLLKNQAAQIGADAIIETRLEYEYGYYKIAVKATGTAVKFK